MTEDAELELWLVTLWNRYVTGKDAQTKAEALREYLIALVNIPQADLFLAELDYLSEQLLEGCTLPVIAGRLGLINLDKS